MHDLIPFTVAGLTVLLYDALLTFTEELHFIWSPVLRRVKQSGIRGLTFPRSVILYLISRYCMLTIGMLYLNGKVLSPQLLFCCSRRYRSHPIQGPHHKLGKQHIVEIQNIVTDHQ